MVARSEGYLSIERVDEKKYQISLRHCGSEYSGRTTSKNLATLAESGKLAHNGSYGLGRVRSCKSQLNFFLCFFLRFLRL
jgi:hypothetical protein